MPRLLSTEAMLLRLSVCIPLTEKTCRFFANFEMPVLNPAQLAIVLGSKAVLIGGLVRVGLKLIVDELWHSFCSFVLCILGQKFYFLHRPADVGRSIYCMKL